MKTYELSKPDFFVINTALLLATLTKTLTPTERSNAARLQELFAAAHDGELHIETD